MKKLLVYALSTFFFSIVFFTSANACTPQLTIFSATNNLAVGQLDNEYVGSFSQNNITGWNPSECQAKEQATGEGIWKGTAFNLTEGELYGLSQMAIHENGSYEGFKMELSLMANKADIAGRTDIAEYIGNSCWFATSKCYSTNKYIESRDGLPDEYVEAAKDILLNGNRVLPPEVDEHDCLCDIAYIETDGVRASPNDRSAYVSEKTIISNNMGSTYTFFAFPSDTDGGDPFGYTHGPITPSSSSSGSSNSSNASSTSSSAGSEDGSNVTIIGDSITNAAKDAILGKLPNADIHAKDCKTVGVDVNVHCGGADPPNESGLNIVKSLKSGGTLRDKVVFALGTNGAGFDKLQEAINEIGSDRQIYLMTLFETSSDHSGQNETINQIANDNDNDNVTVFDWAGAVSGNTGLLTDGTHPNAEGAEIFANLIYDAVNKANCTSYEGDYPQYWQGNYEDSDHEHSDHDWTGDPYNGNTIASDGCGPTSAAMLATVATGEDIYPYDVVEATSPGDYVDDGGVALDMKLGEKYGFEVIFESYSDKTDAYNKMKKYLNDGYMIHFSGEGLYPGFSNIYTDGHFVGIFSIDANDKVQVANSAFMGNSEASLQDMVDAIHHGIFTAIKGNSSSGSCSNDYCSDGGDGASHSGGFTSAEEAQKVIMEPYIDLAANHPEQWGEYNIAAGTPYNCFSFSNYFITKYTTIDFSGVPGVDGGAYATAFYEQYHDSYPDLVLGDKPVPYSVAGCGEASYSGSNYSHTFIVLGVDEANDKMIYGEASYGCDESCIRANEISLTDPEWGSRNGSTGICTYTDFSKYIKGL